MEVKEAVAACEQIAANLKARYRDHDAAEALSVLIAHVEKVEEMLGAATEIVFDRVGHPVFRLRAACEKGWRGNKEGYLATWHPDVLQAYESLQPGGKDGVD